MFERIITTSLSPNTNKKQLHLCLKNILNPFLWGNWKKGPEEQKLIEKFQAYFQGYEAVSFGSGRAALYYLLKSFGVTTGDEVIVQAYTCVSVPNSIVWLGAKPVYVDVRNDFNMDPELIEPAITSKTKVILTQNTFGKPADIRRIKDIAEKHNLILIEDAAHALGAEVASQKIGGFGDGAIFSFGRDKVISSVAGGMAICKNKEVAQKLRSEQEKLPQLSWLQIYKHLLHPIIFTISIATYNFFSFGKFFAFMAKKLRLFPLVLTAKEKKGQKPANLFVKLPDILAGLALDQFQNLETKNKARIKKAHYYQHNLASQTEFVLPEETEGEKSIYMRYTILAERAQDLKRLAREQNIFLGDWYSKVIAPNETDLESVYYEKGSAPQAERLASQSINLPNHGKVSPEDQDKVISLLKNYSKKDD